MPYNRLDDRYIEDDVHRALFHQALLRRVAAWHPDNFQYTIRVDEVFRSDLAAFRAYGNADLRWVFRLLVGHESETEEMPAGKTLTLPDLAWIRNGLRDFAGSRAEIANG